MVASSQAETSNPEVSSEMKCQAESDGLRDEQGILIGVSDNLRLPMRHKQQHYDPLVRSSLPPLSERQQVPDGPCQGV
jgi:hypothetical protein